MNHPLPKIDNIADLALLLEAAGILEIKIEHRNFFGTITLQELVRAHSAEVVGTTLKIHLQF